MDNSSIESHSFKDPYKSGYNHRIEIKMKSGDVYSIAVESDPAKIRLPESLKNIFWAKVHLPDGQTVLINRNSLAKRTGTTGSLTKFVLKNQADDKSFDAAMRILNKADRIAKNLKEDHTLRFRREQKAEQIVKVFEENIENFKERLEKKGAFVEKKKGYTFIVSKNPEDNNKMDVYIKLSKEIGKGAFKTVHSLMHYETAEANYALSIHKLNLKNISDGNPQKVGVDVMKELEGEKSIMKAEVFIEKIFNQNGMLHLDEDTGTYLITKRYEGTFSKLNDSNKLPLNTKLELFTQILGGVSSMHKRGLIHCDLKGDNVLFKKKKNGELKIKIIDLDLSLLAEEFRSVKITPGTPLYKPPEALAQTQITRPDKLDSFSLGIMLYELCEGEHPYAHKMMFATDLADVATVGVKNLKFKKLTDENEAIRAVIKGLLNPDPIQRMSVDIALRDVNAYLNPNIIGTDI